MFNNLIIKMVQKDKTVQQKIIRNQLLNSNNYY